MAAGLSGSRSWGGVRGARCSLGVKPASGRGDPDRPRCRGNTADPAPYETDGSCSQCGRGVRWRGAQLGSQSWGSLHAVLGVPARLQRAVSSLRPQGAQGVSIMRSQNPFRCATTSEGHLHAQLHWGQDPTYDSGGHEHSARDADAKSRWLTWRGALKQGVPSTVPAGQMAGRHGPPRKALGLSDSGRPAEASGWAAGPRRLPWAPLPARHTQDSRFKAEGQTKPGARGAWLD